VLDQDVAVVGELGLSGELRASANMELRLNHARAMGVSEVIGPIGIESEGYTPLAGIEEVCEALGLGVEVKKPKRRKRK
jgi:predicted ATP-dependent serine protease